TCSRLHITALSAGPAVFLDLSGLGERSTITLRRFRVVEREVEEEHLAGVRAPGIKARSHHTDLIAHLQAVAAGQEIRPLPVARQLVAEEIIDDDRLAPGIEQALAAIQARGEHQ